MIGSRVKEMRKALGLTQYELADQLGVSRTNIANYEVGRVSPSDASIKLICREFNVREKWLRNGEGEMFRPMDRDEELAEAFGRLLRDDTSDFKKRLFLALSKLDEQAWEALEQFALQLVQNRKED